jgi:hypothetical protein
MAFFLYKAAFIETGYSTMVILIPEEIKKDNLFLSSWFSLFLPFAFLVKPHGYH